jgi:hypothetical protein
MIPVGAGGIAMAATANATIQLNVPDGLRGRVMSVYTTVFASSVPIGGIASGALASVVGIPLTVAIGGVLSLAVGGAAFVWWRRIGAASMAASRPATSATGSVASGSVASGPAAVEAAAGSPVVDAVSTGPGPQSTEPKTSAAFNPPKPNEVLSTRR